MDTFPNHFSDPFTREYFIAVRDEHGNIHTITTERYTLAVAERDYDAGQEHTAEHGRGRDGFVFQRRPATSRKH